MSGQLKEILLLNKKSEIMRISKFLILIVFISMVCSCRKPVADKQYSNVSEMVKDLKKSVNTISQADFKKILDSKAKYNLLDCRESEFFDSVCIPGAVNVARGILEFKVGDKIQERRKILYIYSDSEEKSILAATALKEIKYSEVVVIEGSFNDWVSAFPEFTEKEPNKGKNSDAPPPKKEEGGCEG